MIEVWATRDRSTLEDSDQAIMEIAVYPDIRLPAVDRSNNVWGKSVESGVYPGSRKRNCGRALWSHSAENVHPRGS